MAERVARVVGDGPRRRFGFGTIAAAMIAAAVMLLAGVFASAPAARAFSRTPHAAASAAQQQSINSKVNSLINQMTVAEKFGQLEMAGPDGPNGTPGSLVSEAKNGEIGTVLDLVGVNNINTVQQAALNSRLHIPLIFCLDVIHGYKTMFPVLARRSDKLGPGDWSRTTRSCRPTRRPRTGSSGRSIRWSTSAATRAGDGVEGAGEDPFLGSAIAAAKVRGYQGSDFSAPDKMAATIKHFGGVWGPGGRSRIQHRRHVDPAAVQRLPAAVQGGVDAGVATVMASFNSLNGVPNTANPYMLQTILRDEWGFGGATLSDYQAVQELEDFGFANGGSEAARWR